MCYDSSLTNSPSYLWLCLYDERSEWKPKNLDLKLIICWMLISVWILALTKPSPKPDLALAPKSMAGPALPSPAQPKAQASPADAHSPAQPG